LENKRRRHIPIPIMKERHCNHNGTNPSHCKLSLSPPSLFCSLIIQLLPLQSDVPEGIIALKMSLKEKALIGDHVVGSCVVPLYLLPTKTREEKWFELKKKDTVIGEVQIRVQFLPNESLKKISEQGELPLVARSMSSFVGIGEKENNNEEDPTSSLRCLSAQELASPPFATGSNGMSFIPTPAEPFHPPPLNTLLVIPREGARSARMNRTESEMFTKVEKTADLLSFNIFRSLHDKRKVKKSNLFRMLFGLPETEELLFGEYFFLSFFFSYSSFFLLFFHVLFQQMCLLLM
jgi:hypothetical protein